MAASHNGAVKNHCRCDGNHFYRIVLVHNPVLKTRKHSDGCLDSVEWNGGMEWYLGNFN